MEEPRFEPRQSDFKFLILTTIIYLGVFVCFLSGLVGQEEKDRGLVVHMVRLGSLSSLGWLSGAVSTLRACPSIL